MHPKRPDDLPTPGLTWQRRGDRYVAYWLCRRDILARGYPVKTQRMWPPSETPDAVPMREDWELISTRCQRLQGEMLAFNVNPSSTTASADRFDDTITSLVRIYMDDEDSPIHDLRYHTRKHYEIKLNGIVAAVGQARVSMLSFRDFKRWHEGWKKPKIEGGLERTARAHGFMSFVRIVFSFGALSELPHCARLHAVLSKMEFPNPKRRTKIINAEQAAAIRKEAHRRGNPSIALAQAFQFDLMLRQKDVVGEWVPTSEPGISDIAYHDKKWLNGLRWEEITGNSQTPPEQIASWQEGDQ